MERSALQIARSAYQPKLPKALQGAVKIKEGAPTQSVDNQEEIKKLFPNTYGMPLVEFVPGEGSTNAKINVGVILSGGQAPGGHNVITGLFDQLKRLNPENRLFGFILGPGGFVDHHYMELTAELVEGYRNTGGFDMIGSGRTKLEKVDQFEKGLEILRELDIKALDPDCLRILVKGVLEVHRHVIDVAFGQDLLQPVRERAVGIKFYLVTHRLDLCDKLTDVRMQKRFAACDSNSVKDPLSFLEESEKLVFADPVLFRGIEIQCRVVAEGASQIAADRKNRTSYRSGEIQKSQLLKSADDHTPIPRL